MIPLEDLILDGEDFALGSGRARGEAKPRLEVTPELTIREVFFCCGCGRELDAPAICAECREERDVLNGLWDFGRWERSTPASAERKAAAWVGLWAAIGCGALTWWVALELAAWAASWIGGRR